MKLYTSILMLICFATFSQAQSKFDDQWKQVTKLENDGLTKSASELVDIIYNDALKAQNKQQQIKALLHLSKYMLVLEENAQLSIVNRFKNEIKTSKNIVTKHLLENMLATLYWQYFQQNRYQFYSRTKTEEKPGDDFRTWDLETLFNEIHTYYKRSLENGLLLQKEPLKNYRTLLNEAKNSKLYRPTLFDLLSHNALNFYVTSENSITKPAYQFKIENKALLGDSETFIDLELSSKDTLSLQLNALKVYQNLIKFHRQSKATKAFVNVDTERLTFVHQQATFTNKDAVLIETLKQKAKQLKASPLSALYNFELASIYAQQGYNFDIVQFNSSPDQENRWKLKEAVDLCDKVIELYPKSNGAAKCKVLKAQILQPTIGLQAEEYIPINAASRLLVDYKNLSKLDFSIYKIDRNQLETFNQNYDSKDQIKFFKKLKPIKTFSSDLKSEGDHQRHHTEIILPALVNGLYLIKAETNSDRKVFAAAHIQITNLALVESVESDVVNYQLIDRTNGAPIKDAVISLSYKDNRNKHFNKMLSTNRYGKFSFKKDKNYYRALEIRADYNNEIAFFGNYNVGRHYEQHKNNDTRHNVYLFTDRSIYRPGQTVFFKGIATATKDNLTEVFTDETATIRLKNVNNEVISELSLRINEYGSVSGEFILPTNGLTGNYTIEIICGRTGYSYFAVEEYKRPKFKPEFKPVVESYKVNDIVTVKGNAIAFAGSNISDAKVTYRVKRQVQYPNWYYWRRPNYYNSEAQEITFGETNTDASGNFEITFKAIPDDNVSKDNLPTFRYEVSADVTDINGETRSTSTVVNVGYHAMTLNIMAPQDIDKSKKEIAIKLLSKNLNGEEIPAIGTLKVFKLNAPEQVLRARPWNAPDYQVIPKERFISLFPNEPYNDEHLLTNWEKGELVFTSAFNTEKDKSVTLKKLKKWASGKYLIVAESEDKFGQEVKDQVYTTLFSENDKTVADHQLFEVSLDKTSYKAGDIAQLTLGSAAKDITVTVEIEKEKKIIVTQLVKLNNSKQTISIPILEGDIGGFVVHTSLAAFNSYVSQSHRLNVPYPKTHLEIETKTFRDKLQPGQEETWSFKIKGPKGDKVTAELLASMYDASLDEFQPHDWSFSPIYNPTYSSRINKNHYQSFSNVGFRLFNRFAYPNGYKVQSYDQLNWFGLSFDGSHYYQRQRYLRSRYANMPSYFSSNVQSGIKNGLIKGTIRSEEDGLPLPGVSIVLKGTNRGAQSDFDGNFEIEAKKGEVITISYIGTKPIEIKITNDNFYTINLVPDNEALDEVVVVGYGMKTKESLTGTASAVHYETERAMPQLNAFDADGVNDEFNDANYYRGNNYSKNEFKDGDKRSVDNAVDISQFEKEVISSDNFQIRKNLNETAFFFPQLQTDAEGNVSFNFTAPEALTKWKLQLLAHTKTLESAVTQLEAVTQKELMVIPNAPRFLREGDKIRISTKIANLTEKELSGIAQLLLTDPITGKSLNGDLFVSEALEGTNNGEVASRTSATKNFKVDSKGNTKVTWNITIPEGLQVVQYKIIARADDFSDGEQNALPVLSNRMLVTETLPMWVRSNQTKTFTLDKLALSTSANASKTLTNHKLTLEMTSNPAWYAVQALPYLMEYPYDCNEQTFSRYYANALAQHIVQSNPKIQAVFNQWKSSDTSTGPATALLSNLEKNQELKSLLIQETPWLRDAQSETEQKKRIGLLFDLNKMNNELSSALNKLRQNQSPTGGWPWFNGGRTNRYITQHIVAGFGHLKHLNVISTERSDEKSQMIASAIQYLDQEFIKEYKDLKKYNKDVDLSKDHLSYSQLHYLYVRSFYPELKRTKELGEIMNYYKDQIKTHWLSRPLYAKGLMTLTMHRMNDDITAGKILKSLKENSITSEELGMYWKANTNSWYWYQAPIETQAILIEAFSEVGSVIQSESKTIEDIDNLKIWLLKHKQTNQWKTTKATTEAVYALLLQGSSWLDVTEMVKVKVGNENISPETLENVKLEAGTGYYKTSWTGPEIKPEQADVTITKKGDGIAWGALYWQYFEDLDKITSAETPLQLSKKLYLKSNTDKGEEISEITADTKLNLGDLVRVRIELRTDRSMEFVHLKDMRAAGFEPINVLSRYKWQDGLGYYESTKDAATNFFIDYLPKGIYVFEYDLRVNNAGDMSNGISTIQSMYAPEFSSHSEGVRVLISD